MRIVKNKRGQFIVIAVMMIAVMMVSIGALMYGAGTYYRSEQWEEYMTLVEHIKLGTIRLVEMSLANYTGSGDTSILKVNLNQWQSDLRKAYPGFGVILEYDLANATHHVYGTDIDYYQGLASHWNETSSYSGANVTVALNIMSVGLKGYRFMATAFLNLTIVDVDTVASEIIVTVTGEDKMAITNLKRGNFEVYGSNVQNVTLSYDLDYGFIYTIICDSLPPSNITVRVSDQRGIRVTAKRT